MRAISMLVRSVLAVTSSIPIQLHFVTVQSSGPIRATRPVSFLIAVRASPRRQTREHRHFARPLLERLCRRSSDYGARGDIIFGMRAAGDLSAVADLDMTHSA